MSASDKNKESLFVWQKADRKKDFTQDFLDMLLIPKSYLILLLSAFNTEYEHADGTRQKNLLSSASFP